MHHFKLEDDDGFPWLKMVLASSAEKSEIPSLIKQGQALTGALELHLMKPQDISSIDIQVLCYEILTARVLAGDVRKVYQSNHNIWNSSLGHPHTHGPPEKHMKLDGKFDWQFSIKLPDTFTPDHGLAKDYGLAPSLPLPPSVPVSDGIQFLNYSLTVKVKRAGFFSSDSEMTTEFFYLPNTAPSPPSLLRQLAYEENSEPLGPELDPLGWTNVTVDEIHGKANGTNVTVHAILSLANPLTYTIGSFIPVLLTFRCSDPQTLNLLYNTGTPVVQSDHNYKFEFPMLTPRADLSRYNEKFQLDRPCEAKWMRPQQEQIEGDKRVLLGEIHLPPTLCPTFEFGKMFEKYDVKMLGFTAKGFTSELKTRSKTEVTLVSEYASGPRPVPRVP